MSLYIIIIIIIIKSTRVIACACWVVSVRFAALVDHDFVYTAAPTALPPVSGWSVAVGRVPRSINGTDPTVGAFDYRNDASGYVGDVALTDRTDVAVLVQVRADFHFDYYVYKRSISKEQSVIVGGVRHAGCDVLSCKN